MTTAVGVTIGAFVALGVTQTLQNLLFGVTPTDPVAFAAAIAVLMGVATLACYLPARRAILADPTEALRQQ
jgi:putative ABC transport system permease protein